MNKLRLLCLAILFAVTALWSLGDVVKVDFESGIPAGWTQNGVSLKSDNGSTRAAMGANATLTSPVIKGATSVAYKHRGSGSNKELTVSVSADGGATWQQIGSSKVSSSSSYGSASHAVGLGTSASVTVKFTCLSATIYVDDIEITYVNSAEEPTVASGLALTDRSGSTATLAVTPGNGAGRLVAFTKDEKLGWAPQDGKAYEGIFPRKEGDVTIAASADITTVTLENLEPGTTYTAAVFEYNGTSESRNYLTEGVQSVTFTTLTVPTIAVPATVAFNNTKTGTKKVKSVALTGMYLNPGTGTLKAESNSELFTVSTDGVNFAKQANIDYANGGVNNILYIQFAPQQKGVQEGKITVSGGGASATIDMTGTGADMTNVEYYIAPDGDDVSGDGSMERPWMNLQKAVNAALPGDEIICRGGRYHFTMRDGSGKLTVRIKSSGTAESPITIRAYAGEQPVFDFEQQLLDCNRDRSKVGDRGILLSGNYWHLYGLHIMHAADNGIKLEGSHNRIERCEFSYNLDTGLQLGFGHNFADTGFGSKNDGSYCAYNDIIDCDSHHNCDYDANYGSDADGFACKMHNGIGNRFIRCRAWRNSDDAWDLYETDFSVVLVECWAWESGNAEDHTWVYDYFDKGPSFSGNGNGIKLGGNGTGGSSKGVHYAYNCVAFGCDKSGSTKGFDCNSHKDGHVVIGGLAFDNGYDFMFESGGGANSEFYNNVCFGRQEILVGTESHNALGVTPNPGKTFCNNVVTDFSRSDYESLSEADALAPRGEDGSMPGKFARLRSGSKLIDAGLWKPNPVEDDYPFLHQSIFGNGRDLGPYELEEGAEQSGVQMIMSASKATRFEITKSGNAGEWLVGISVAEACEPVITISDIQGRSLRVMRPGLLIDGADYTFPLDSHTLSAGIYLVTVHLPGSVITRKVIL